MDARIGDPLDQFLQVCRCLSVASAEGFFEHRTRRIACSCTCSASRKLCCQALPRYFADFELALTAVLQHPRFPALVTAYLELFKLNARNEQIGACLAIVYSEQALCAVQLAGLIAKFAEVAGQCGNVAAVRQQLVLYLPTFKSVALALQPMFSSLSLFAGNCLRALLACDHWLRFSLPCKAETRTCKVTIATLLNFSFVQVVRAEV